LVLLGLRRLSLNLLPLPLSTLDIKLLHLGVELFDFLILVVGLRFGFLSKQLIAHVFVHLHALVVVGVGIGGLKLGSCLRFDLLVNLKEGLVKVILVSSLGLCLEFGQLTVALILLLLDQNVTICLETTTAIVSGLHLRDLFLCK
jgi:hypothetical protein